MSRVFIVQRGHALEKEFCPFCENQFTAGEEVVLEPQPPEDDERRKMEAGQAFTTPAVAMHRACAALR